MMKPEPAELFAALCFTGAMLHSLNVKFFEEISKKLRPASLPKAFFHLLSEVEAAFSFWAFLYLICLFLSMGPQYTIEWIRTLHFNEALFVTGVMILTSTPRVLNFSSHLIESLSKCIPLATPIATYGTLLTLGPLLGSFITEPAAMTVSALLLSKKTLKDQPSLRLVYSTLAVLFVNISIGGVLTHFAAPPVLMIAKSWNYDTAFMFLNFGWKAIIAVFLNTTLVILLNRKELKVLSPAPQIKIDTAPQYKAAIGVGCFLAALTLLTAKQAWWLAPLLNDLKAFSLFLSTTLLTGITDNAALTSLARELPHLSTDAKYAILAGAITGGGLTLIANAPNPAGFALLKNHFGDHDFKPSMLLYYALIPTLIAGGLFWIL